MVLMLASSLLFSPLEINPTLYTERTALLCSPCTVTALMSRSLSASPTTLRTRESGTARRSSRHQHQQQHQHDAVGRFLPSRNALKTRREAANFATASACSLRSAPSTDAAPRIGPVQQNNRPSVPVNGGLRLDPAATTKLSVLLLPTIHLTTPGCYRAQPARHWQKWCNSKEPDLLPGVMTAAHHLQIWSRRRRVPRRRDHTRA
ncbi:hypothetical protein B0J12DRAFT_339826 [Macrophomina phaseolina]|uniref:Uncharacterized protein n=1 Tax=Macrophomina phaseolina TaxID=35725 RepID=A0ABQ8GMK8_9PEZI|nr:hypothetical protein B0J12DRAFT_339826 [Macrophomina phaseolina]